MTAVRLRTMTGHCQPPGAPRGRHGRWLLLAVSAVASLVPGVLAGAGSPDGSDQQQEVDSATTDGRRESPIRNVLFLVSDDLRADVLGCYGDPICRSPHLDRLASRGLVFDRAYCQAMWCAPSRESFMHGRYQGDAAINLGLHFRRQGWHSARVGKIYHMRVPGDIIDGTDGLDVPSSWDEAYNCPGSEAHTPGQYACLNLNHFTEELEGRQSTGMPHRPFVTVRYEGDGSDQPDHKAATKAIELLARHRDRPFFLAVGLIRPHYPMVAPNQYFEPYPYRAMRLPEVIEGDRDDIPPLGIAASTSRSTGLHEYPDNQRRMWTGYYASVTFMDEQVGRILRGLDELGLTESTAIVFTSDHGYHLGDHTFWQKSNLHEQVTRVPLIVSVPGKAAGRTAALTELVDLFPTLSELMGWEPPATVQGRSFVAVLDDPAATVRDDALSIHRGGAALRTDRWVYIKYPDDTAELYDMRADPEQFHNLAKASGHREVVGQLDRRLQQRLREAGVRPRPPRRR